MNDPTADPAMDRLGAVSGVLGVALGVLAVALGAGTGAASPGAPPQEIARVYASAPTPMVWLGAYLEVLAYLLLFVFVARLWASLRGAGGGAPSWLATAAVGAGLLSVGLTLVGFAIGSALRARGGPEADASVARTRFDPRTEAALYFCCLEALQNAAKHAAGAAVSVRVSADQAWLTLAVTDQGPGFRPEIAHHGTGLQGMLDRMAAVGGTLEVVSGVGRGTTIRGRAPREVTPPRVQVGAIAAAQAAASDAEPKSALAT